MTAPKIDFIDLAAQQRRRQAHAELLTELTRDIGPSSSRVDQRRAISARADAEWLAGRPARAAGLLEQALQAAHQWCGPVHTFEAKAGDRCRLHEGTRQHCVAGMNVCAAGCRNDDACATATVDGGVGVAICTYRDDTPVYAVLSGERVQAMATVVP